MSSRSTNADDFMGSSVTTSEARPTLMFPPTFDFVGVVGGFAAPPQAARMATRTRKITGSVENSLIDLETLEIRGCFMVKPSLSGRRPDVSVFCETVHPRSSENTANMDKAVIGIYEIYGS